MLWRAPTNSPGVPAAWEGVPGVGGGEGGRGRSRGCVTSTHVSGSCLVQKMFRPCPPSPPPPLHPDTRYHTSLRAHHCTQRSRAVVVLYRSEGVGTYLPVGLAPAAVMCGQPNSSLGVWQLVVTAQRWSLLYIRGPQLDAVNC